MNVSEFFPPDEPSTRPGGASSSMNVLRDELMKLHTFCDIMIEGARNLRSSLEGPSWKNTNI